MNTIELKNEIDNYLNSYFKDKGTYNKYLYESESYSIKNGGKRLRPILIIYTYLLYKDNYKDILPVAAAMEMIHTSSLIHDDLPAMDDDDLRRGKPTNHKVFGEAIAVLAGDALLNEAMIVLINFAIKNGENSLLAAKEIAEAAGADGMMGGQAVDLLSEGKKEIPEDELRYMHLKKTGELIRSSVVSGALLGDAPKDDIKKLNQFGKNIGLVFQIKDDILDIVGDVGKIGKNINMDQEHDKCNFVSVYGMDKCVQLCEEITQESINLLNSLSKDAEKLKKLTIRLLNREY